MTKKRILIVDDEKGFTVLLAMNLDTFGRYEIFIENDPKKAVQAALDFKPDLIMLDVVMPEVEGPDIAFEIKNNNELKDTPILFLTATITSEEVVSRGGKVGGYPFVAKPATIDVLLKSIEKSLKGD